MIISRNEGWLSTTLDDEMLMMHANHGYYVGMNRMAIRIWELLETPRSMDELCAELMVRFDVPADVCRRETEAFVADMVTRKVAVITEPA